MNELEFSDLDISNEILEALKKLGYKKPSKVQKEVIPIALRNKDIIVKSETGSGKTMAFAIPICEKVEIEENDPQALILTPTRELAVQVKEDISNVGRLKRIRCAAIFGKQPMNMQKKELQQRVHVVVGTPGRTLDHIERGNLQLNNIRYLIIDEADKMLNMGFIEQVEAIIKKISSNRITMLFSATISEEIEMLCGKYMNNPSNIEISCEGSVRKKIEELYYEINENKKFNLLNKVLYIQEPDSCIIFCNTKEKVGTLAKKMKDKGYSCNGLHGGMEQKDRLDIMQEFKRGKFRFLIATDVAARGIDVDDITHVINYDIPLEKEGYVHRIGRTGRAGKQGIAITFVTPYELKFLSEIEEYLNYSIPKNEIPSDSEFEEAKMLFKEKVKLAPKLKKDKSATLNKEITKIYINAGKKKKIRPGDIVGAITNISGINPEDIGIIDVQDNVSYVDILNNKGKLVLEALQHETIKGKTLKVQRALKSR